MTNEKLAFVLPSNFQASLLVYLLFIMYLRQVIFQLHHNFFSDEWFKEWVKQLKIFILQLIKFVMLCLNAKC